MKKKFCFTPVIAGFLLIQLIQNGGWVKAQDSWKPFQLPENPTMNIVSDPGAFATLNREFTWELEWTPERSILPGTQIELRSLNLRTYFEWRYTRIEIDRADITMRRPLEITSDDVFALKGRWIIARATLPYGLKMGETLQIRLSAIPPRFSDLDDAVTIWQADYIPTESGNDVSPEFTKIENAAVRLHVNAGPVERLGIYAHPMADHKGKVRVVLAPEDRFSNASAFKKEVPVQLYWGDKQWTEHIQYPLILAIDELKDIGRLKASISMKALSPLDNIANGRYEGKYLIVTSNPVWPVSQSDKIAAFGEFHWHTEISGDGGNPLPEGLKIARDHFNLNYCTPSDHTPSPDKWVYTVDVLENFYEPGAFITFFGWENSTREGHDNYYFTDPDHPMRPFGDANVRHKKPYELQDQLQELQENLQKNEKFIAIPHHTNAVSETQRADGTPYWYEYPFRKPDNYHRLIEVFQARGNMERNEYTDAWRGWYNEEASAQDALAKGYKLGFTAGTDCHAGRPVRCNAAIEDLGRVPLHSQSVTGVWVDKIDRQPLFDGLYHRHTWACWDTRAIVRFSVNEALMGSHIHVEKGVPLTAHIMMSTDDVIQSLEIISGGETVWIGSFDELDLNVSIDLGNAVKDSGYYLRALLRNGGILYGSPVFVTVG